MTLAGLIEKYKAKDRRLTYSQLIKEITAHNTEKLSRGLGRVSASRYQAAADRALGRGHLTMPKWDSVVPPRAYFLRKAQEDGEIITDTLRRRLTASLRGELESMPAGQQPSAAAIRRLEAKVREAMSAYTRGSGGRKPANAHTIAVTELRSAYDEAKHEYARRVLQANPDRVILSKRWVHNDHLVRQPRAHHRALHGVTVRFDESFRVDGPDGTVWMKHPHDPHAPVGEVAGCQCGYEVVVEPRAGAQVGKDRGPVPKIGDVVTRPDGSKWVKTGTFSYRKASQQEADAGHGDASAGAAPAQDAPGKKKPEAKEKPKRELTMTAEQAAAIIDRVGAPGFWNLTKDGLNEFLRAHGVEDPEKLKFEEKKAKFKDALEARKKRDLEENTVKPPVLDPFRNPAFHVEDSDRGISNVDEDRVAFLIENAMPKQGGHWGSAESRNETANAIAFSSGTRWRPIDKQKDGKLADYDAVIDVWTVIKAAGWRKYAQDRIKKLDRQAQPNFFRGMTLSQADFDSIASGASDTIELTGCTAFSCYEKIADRYSKSAWTKKFGEDRRPVKIVLERDDATDESVGMWHPTFHEKNGGGQDPAFELLLGLESVRVVRTSGREKKVDPAKAAAKVTAARAAAAARGQELLADEDRYIENIRKEIEAYATRDPSLLPSWSTRDASPEQIERMFQEKEGYLKGHIAAAEKRKVRVASAMRFASSDDPKVEQFLRETYSRDKKDIAQDLAYYRYIGRVAGEIGVTTAGKTLSEAVDEFAVKGRDRLNNPYDGIKSVFDRFKQIAAKYPDFSAEDLFSFVHVSVSADGQIVDAYKKAFPKPTASVLTLYCVAGRGKKSVEGSSEGLGEEKEKADGN